MPPIASGAGTSPNCAARSRACGTTSTPCWTSSPATSSLTSTTPSRSEEHTSELQSLRHLVCRLLLEKKKKETLTDQDGDPVARARAHELHADAARKQSVGLQRGTELSELAPRELTVPRARIDAILIA